MAAQRIPEFNLEHIEGRNVTLSDFRGRTIVVLLAGQHSVDQAEQIGTTIRSRYGPDQVPLVQIAHLQGTPRMVHALAKRDIKKAYQRQAGQETRRLQAQGEQVSADLSQSVILLLDWDGVLAGGLGLSDLDKTAVAVVADGEGNVRGSATGWEGGEQVLAMLG